MTTLEQVVASVTAETKQAADAQLRSLDEKGAEWTERLRSVDDEGVEVALEGSSPEALSAMVASHVDHAMESLRERAKYLDEIQVALFGRTGAGKSSFIEALTRGTGKSVSPDGRLDYTRQAKVIDWSGVKLIDTPGIEGWSESKDREKIERDAHEAVQRADLVILAFDDYNQKVGEFEQIAHWVSRLGKAAIAVLNLRDDGWRYDARLERMEEREAAVQQVRDHARHTQRMLEAIGLPSVPIVAVNLAWAFGARAKSVKRHPAAHDLAMAREDLGPERLLEVSNFHVVLDFVIELLSRDPEGLRLGTLRHEQEAALENLSDNLLVEQQAASVRAEQIERAITTVLSRTGVPTRARVQDIESKRQRERLEEFLESLRGTALGRPRSRKGEADSILEDHLRASLTKAQSSGLSAAQGLLRRKAGKRASVTPSELEKTALSAAGFREAADEAIDAAFRDLAGRIKADVEDLRADFQCEIEELEASFDAKKGWAKRWGGRGGGVAVTVGAAAFVAFNPELWALAVAVGVGAVGNWLMRKLRKSGNDDRVNARLRAEREVERWLRSATESVSEHAHQVFAEAAWQLAARTQRAAANTAVVERRIERAVEAVRSDVADAQAGLTSAPLASELVQAARLAVEERHFPGDADAAPKAWLGEDWLDEPQGAGGPPAKPLVRPPLGRHITIPVPPGELLDAFWEMAERVGSAHLQLQGPVQDGLAVLDHPPVVAFAGDYSAGKSSLIRRLTTAMGLDAAVDNDKFRIGGDPTTVETALLEGAGIVLCDTPGLNSEDDEHDRLARDAAAGASLIVVTHTPVAGRLDPVLDLLSLDGCLTRQHRALHVLVHIDALSARPNTDPGGFVHLLEAKRTELRERLSEAGLSLHPDTPLPVAADPGGRHARVARWNPQDFESSSGWDGTSDLLSVVRRIAAAGRPLAAVDRTITSLMVACSSTQAELRAAGLRAREHRSICTLLERAVQRHARFEVRAAADLRSVVQTAITARLDELSKMSSGQLAKAQDAPQEWLVTSELKDDFEAWQERTGRDVAKIYTELEQSLEARVHSKAFGRAFQADGNDPLTDSVIQGLKDLLGSSVAKSTDEVAAVAQRFIARIPALAPLAEQLGQAAARGVAVAAGVVLEVIFQADEERRQRKRERTLESAKLAIAKAGEAWVEETLHGTRTQPGVLAGLLDWKREHLERPLVETQQRVAEEDALMDELRGIETAARELIDEGCRVLA